jgi:hypothetical protein
LDDSGYILAVLLIGMAVAAVWMGALLPSWNHQATREKEAELVFRGEQWARAIELYRRRNAGNLPPNLDLLVSQRYIRKKYVDPITGKDFVPVGGITNVPGQQTAQVGVSGVRSTSQASSIVVYRNQQIYSQFPFDFVIEQQKMGTQGAVGGPQPGARGGREGQGPGRGQGGGARGPGGGTIERPGARDGRGPAPARGGGQAPGGGAPRGLRGGG